MFYMWSILQKVIDDRTSNSMEKSMENSKFEIYSHI